MIRSSDINGGTGSTLVGDHNLIGWSGPTPPSHTLFTDEAKLEPLADTEPHTHLTDATTHDAGWRTLG